MADPELPAYLPSDSAPPAAALGVVSSTRVEKEHSYHLDRKGVKWATLIVKSRGPSSSSPPVFLENDEITGRVEINLPKPESFKSITVNVHAGLTAVGQEELPFLDLTTVVWPEPSTRGDTLNGKHTWPFSFHLPSKVSVAEKKGLSGFYNLPPNFSERASPAYIDYRIIVTFKRKGLRANEVLSTYFVYIPSLVAEPPSELRRIAYLDGSPLLGPDIDLHGWQVLSTIHIKGKLFSTRDVDIACTLAVAKPLSYAVRSSIPLRIWFESPDDQALDLIAIYSTIRIFLVRMLTTGSDSAKEDVVRRSNNVFLESAGQASVWPLETNDSKTGRRDFAGEIEVKASLKPAFTFPRLSVRYMLQLLQFQVSGFAPDTSDGNAALISESITITTLQTPGVKPRSYAPPGYEKPQSDDYNGAVGLLENGNQRFLHRVW